MNIRHFFLAGLALAAITAPAYADRIDDFVQAQLKKQNIPAVSVVVLKDGKPIKTRGYGVANLESGTPATPDTVFEIGSVSKQFIASGILLLNGDGKLGLDDSVRKYLEDAPEAWQPITIRHLLTHTSGMIRETPGMQNVAITDIAAIRGAYGTPLSFQPGEKRVYSNLAYFTLAEIITRTSGKPWPEFMRERIFAPLGMTATRTTTRDELVPQRARGYTWANGRHANAIEIIPVRPSGAFLSTVNDLAKWEAALHSDVILTAAQRALLWTPAKLNDGTEQPYGLGWEIGKSGSHRLIRHGGTMLGYRADYSRYVDDDLTVVVLGNSATGMVERISAGIANLYIPGLFPKRTPAKSSAAELDAYTGQYQVTGGVLTVSRREGRLALTMAQGSRTTEMAVVTPEGKGRFFDEDNTRPTYSFEADANGTPQFVMRDEAGKESMRGAKIAAGT